MQLFDAKSQLEDAYRQQEQMVKAMKSSNSHENSLDDDQSEGNEKIEALTQELDRVKAENTLLQYESK